MATSRKRTVEIDVVVDDKAASQKLKGVGDDAQKSAKGFAGLSTGMKTAAIAGGAFVATNIVGFLGDAVTAAAEDERAQKDLARQLEASTGATETQIEAVEEYIKQTSLATGVTDDELRPAFETLARATGDATEAQELLTVAMDISAATGKPLQAVVDAISKAAQNGSTGGLARLGLKIKDVNGEMLTLDEIMQNAADTMGGAMAEQADTAAGKMAILNVKMEEAKEALGEQLMPTFLEAIEMFGNFVTALATVEQGWQDFGTEVASTSQKWKDFIGFTKEEEAILNQPSPLDNWIAGLFGAGEAAVAGAEGMDIARHATDRHRGAIEDATGAAEDAEAAEGDLAGAIETTMDIRQEAHDQVKGQMDSFFALVDATEDQAEAQAAVNELERLGLQNTPSYTEAVRTLAEASLDVEDAQMRLLTSGGMTRTEFEKQRIAMGLDADQAQVLIDKYNIIFTPQSVTHTINYHETGRVTGHAGTETDVSGRLHSGGHVPGVPGSEVPMMLRAGEFVSQGGTPAHGNGNGGPMIVQVNVDGKRFIEELVVPQLARYSRRNGGLGL